jgi:Na+/phosphate symporter
MSSSKEQIKDVTGRVYRMLAEKNEAYGNSALEPINIFSKGDAVESLQARIDDKLARIKNRGLNDETEDTLFDLCGYLILLIIAKENLHEK